MKHLHQENCFLIRSVDYGDNHKIVSCLTQNTGRVDLIALGAKNSRKRFSGALDFINLLSISFEESTRGSLKRMKDVELLESFPDIRKDYERTIFALNWLRLLSQALVHEGQIPGLFNTLRESFNTLSTASPAWVDAVFRYRLLSTLGYHLELHHCVKCRQNNKKGQFNVNVGGLICSNCIHNLSSSPVLEFYPEEWWDLQGPCAESESRQNKIKAAKLILNEAYREYLGLSTAC